MEKIVAGVPYEISIEPSVDIGEFNAEIIISLSEFNMGVKLEPIKGETHKYSFIVPSSMKGSLDKKASKYKLYVYKENARFEVDKGSLQFIDEDDFLIDNKDGKMKRVDGKRAVVKPKPTKTPNTTAKVTPKPKSKPKKVVVDKPEDKSDKEESEKVQENNDIFDKSIPELFGNKNTTNIRTNLQDMLKSVEERNEDKAKRDKINENIQKAIKESKNKEVEYDD